MLKSPLGNSSYTNYLYRSVRITDKFSFTETKKVPGTADVKISTRNCNTGVFNGCVRIMCDQSSFAVLVGQMKQKRKCITFVDNSISLSFYSYCLFISLTFHSYCLSLSLSLSLSLYLPFHYISFSYIPFALSFSLFPFFSVAGGKAQSVLTINSHLIE